MTTLGDVSLALTSSAGNRRLPLTVGERVLVRVVEVRPDHVELEIKGLRVLAGPVDGVVEGESFAARVDALQPTVVLRRVAVPVSDGAARGDTVSPGVAGSSGAAMRLGEWIGHGLFQHHDGSAAGRLLAGLGSSLGLAHDGAAGEHTLARLFRFFGLDEGGAAARLEQRVAGEPIARMLDKWLKAPPDEKAGKEDAAGLRETLASLKKSVETVVAANRILAAADQPLFLEWPLMGGAASPVRLLLTRERGGEGSEKQSASTRVDMSFRTEGLGPVRVTLTLAGGLDAVIAMREEALDHMREEHAGLVESLGAIRRGATVRLETLAEDDALPDLTTLLTRAKGGLGRLHVTA